MRYSKAISKRSKIFLAVSFFLFIFSFIFCFTVGNYPLRAGDILQIISSKLLGIPSGLDTAGELVVLKIRLPRILAGTMVGAGLAAAGAAYQGLFKNPIASPDVLGASSGASFGAALALLLSASYAMVATSAFLFGLLAVALVYLISQRSSQSGVIGLVLVGIVVAALFDAGLSLIKLLADPNNTLPAITYWLMGSLASVEMKDVAHAALPIVAGMVALLLLRWKMNLLTMGKQEAQTMGVNIRLLHVVVIIAATLITAAGISISGNVGWVGLVVPHMARLLVGYDYRILLPTSMLLGASNMLLVDALARSLSSAEVPLGILMAFVGAPFFLYLILKRGDTI